MIFMVNLRISRSIAVVIEDRNKSVNRYNGGMHHNTTVRYTWPPVRYDYDVNDQRHDHAPDRGGRLNRHGLMGGIVMKSLLLCNINGVINPITYYVISIPTKNANSKLNLKMV